MKPTTFNWSKISREDMDRITSIVTRWEQWCIAHQQGRQIDRFKLQMDLAGCHISGCPLDFAKLLDFASDDFVHDITGIQANIDRRSGKLLNCFLPRCAR